MADWDYVIPGLTSKNWSMVKNSLPVARSFLDNTPRNIDIFKRSIILMLLILQLSTLIFQDF